MSPAQDLSARHAARPIGIGVGEVITSAAVVGAVILVEPELAAGLAIGASAVLASRWLSEALGSVVRPVAKSMVRTGYAAAEQTREIVNEASKEVHDLMAEARAERESKPAAP